MYTESWSRDQLMQRAYYKEFAYFSKKLLLLAIIRANNVRDYVAMLL